MKRILLVFAAAILAAMCTSTPKAVPDAMKGTWNGQLELAGLAMVVHLGDTCTMDSPDQGAYGIKAIVKDAGDDYVNIKIPEVKGGLKLRLQGDSLTGTFSQSIAKMPITMQRGPLVRYRPQVPLHPYPYDYKEVAFKNGDIRLAGTLCLPESLDAPAVVLVSGSGKQDRNESLMDHKPFLILSDALARAGIPSLRYDDRECGGSSGVFEDATTADFAEDAASAVRYLRGLGFSKVGVIGHSEGGTIAFMLAGTETPSDGTPDFIVSLAGMADRGDSTLFRQTKQMLILQGAPEKAASFGARIAAKQSAKAMGKWGKYFVSLDPAPYITRIKCPVLALNGSKDCQVIPEFNLSKVEALCPQADCRLYPGLNHLFQHCGTGLSTEYASIEETMSEEVLADIADWINKQ